MVTLSLSIDSNAKRVLLSGTNREGQFGYLYFSCYESPGSKTRNPECNIFENDNLLGIDLDKDGSILITTRNGYLSDVGFLYSYLTQEEAKGHHAFYLEGTPEENPPMRGPLFSFRLYPAPAGECPSIGFENEPSKE